MSLGSGARLGPYEVIGPLGAGGMGEVYRARDTRLGRFVAIKLLPAELAGTTEARSRLRIEAQAISRLNHPNICTLYDIGIEGDNTYLVMELLEGVTLELRLRKGPPPVGEIMRVGTEVARGLDAAHRKGIIHRDLKPSNIALTKHGAKLLDFGLAHGRELGPAPGDSGQSPTVSSPITSQGAIVGTLQYMSPEQLEGKIVDARSDLWSFGAILYEMVTGKSAFPGNSQASIIAAIMERDPVPISDVSPACPLPLRRLIARCLVKNPEQRWQTAHDLSQELEGMLADQSGPSGRPQGALPHARSPWRFVWPAIGLAGAVALALLLFCPQHGPKVNSSVRVQPLDLPFGETGYPGFSRDGQWVAVPALARSGKPGLYLMNVHGGDPRLIFESPDLQWTNYADISPDGSHIALSGISAIGSPQVRVLPALGGEDRLIAEGFLAQWRPDGERIGYHRVGRISKSRHLEFWSVRPDGNDARLEFTDTTCTGNTARAFAWSPDGRRVAYIRELEGGADQVIMIRDLGGGRPRQLTREREGIDELCWTSRNDIVFSSNRSGTSNLWVIRASGGAATQLTRGSGPDLGVRLSGDGTTVLCMQRRPGAQVWIGNFATGSAHQVMVGDPNPLRATLSPDGRRIAVSIAGADPMGYSAPLYVMSREGLGRRRITGEKSRVAQADWSLDGRSLVYADGLGDTSSVWTIDIAGGIPPRRIGRGQSAWWMSDSTITVVEPLRSTLYAMPEGRVLERSDDSTVVWDIAGYRIVSDGHAGREGLWTGKIGPASGGLRRLDVARRDVVSLPRSSSFVLCHNDSVGFYRVWFADGRRERVRGNFPGFTPNASMITNWGDREFVYMVPVTSSRLLLISGWR